MKRNISLLSLALSALILSTSCSEQDNSTDTKEIELEEGKVIASQAWDGYEDLQGKSFGNVFTMPEKIEPTTVDNVYSIFAEKDEAQADKDICKEYFKKVFGDDYNEKCIVNMPEGDYTYSEKSSDNYAVFRHGPGTVSKNGAVPLSMTTSGYSFKNRYIPTKDRDVLLDIGKEKQSVGAICDAALKYCSNIFEGHFKECELYAADLIHFYNSDTDNYAADVTIGLKYERIPLEYRFTPLDKRVSKSFYVVGTYYVPATFDLDLYGIDDIGVLSVYWADNKLRAETLNGMIPLKETVKILERELAPNSKYKFNRVELLYCKKKTSPIYENDPIINASIDEDYGEVVDPPFVPTWVFTVNTNTSDGSKLYYIKLNAVTGEITIDK